MSSQPDPTVLELLRGSALAPMIDQPVSTILQDMGLPTLPQLPALPPLPDMPAMPVIDLSALLRPLTDLASSFGTGALGNSGTGADPTEVLSGITSALQTAMQLGSTALQTATSLWQGAGATGAATKAGQAATNGAELATQGAQEKAVLAGGATSVGVGAAEMSIVISRYLAMVAASAPFLAMPGGQVFLASATAESIAEGLAVVAKTRAELTVHTAEMTAAGRKVDVTDAPTGVDSMQQVMQMLQPLLSLATTAVQSATDVAEQFTSATESVEPIAAVDGDVDPVAATGAGGGAVGAIGGVGGGLAAAAAPLSQWTGTKLTGGTSLPGGAGNSSTATESDATAVRATSSPGGMMPMGGMGMAGARMAGDAGDMPTFLVSAQHGDEVVGELDGASLPVVGAAELVSEPSPDKQLTL
ncbi:hypothetical protein ACWF9G_00815 [Nocardia sp. NPDC055029]